MAGDLESLQPTRVADTRYITLTHLYNACASDEEMEVYRQGTVKLLNSLSRVSDVVRLETIDEAKTIIRFNLKDLGWEPEDWDKILAVYPYGSRPDSKMYDLLSSSTVTPLPFIRGDWFAFSAAQPPLYDKLLKLADNFQGLQKDLGVDVAADLAGFIVKRVGLPAVRRVAEQPADRAAHDPDRLFLDLLRLRRQPRPPEPVRVPARTGQGRIRLQP